MDLPGTNINTNTFVVGGKVERIQTLSAKNGSLYFFGTIINEFYKEGLQFPLKSYINFKCFSGQCVEAMKSLKVGSTVVFCGYLVNDYYLNKNKEKMYDKYLFIEKVKVLSTGKQEPPSDPAMFTEEDLPF